jgi:hypothetical protein
MHGEFLGYRILDFPLVNHVMQHQKMYCVVVAIVILGYYFITFKV